MPMVLSVFEWATQELIHAWLPTIKWPCASFLFTSSKFYLSPSLCIDHFEKSWSNVIFIPLPQKTYREGHMEQGLKLVRKSLINTKKFLGNWKKIRPKSLHTSSCVVCLFIFFFFCLRQNIPRPTSLFRKIISFVTGDLTPPPLV